MNVFGQELNEHMEVADDDSEVLVGKAGFARRRR